MNTKNRHFPYPILREYSDDYINSYFKTEIKIKEDINSFIFEFNSELNDETITNLINKEKAEIVYQIECPQLFFRYIIKTRSLEIEFAIDSKKLNGSVKVSSYIVAKDDIDDYTNINFHTDFEDSKFKLFRGNIIALGNQYKLIINKNLEKLSQNDSIFLIVRDDSSERSAIKIDTDNDKIKIILNNEDFKNYNILSKRIDLLPSMHAMIIYPALLQVLEKIRTSNIQEYEDMKWFNVITYIINKSDYEILEYIEKYGTEVLAQKLLDFPINRALKSLVSIGEDEE